jgi:hypothetical protein
MARAQPGAQPELPHHPLRGKFVDAKRRPGWDQAGPACRVAIDNRARPRHYSVGTGMTERRGWASRKI